MSTTIHIIYSTSLSTYYTIASVIREGVWVWSYKAMVACWYNNEFNDDNDDDERTYIVLLDFV